MADLLTVMWPVDAAISVRAAGRAVYRKDLVD